MTRSRDLDRARDLGLARARARARDLARDVDVDRTRTRALALARARDLAPDHDYRVCDVAVTIEQALERTQLLQRRLQSLELSLPLLEQSLQAEASQGATIKVGSAPGRVSRGVVALAVRALPARDQPRYREEFRTELVELRRRHRLGYTLRVLSSAWQLRRALTETVRTAEGEVVRRATER